METAATTTPPPIFDLDDVAVPDADFPRAETTLAPQANDDEPRAEPDTLPPPPARRLGGPRLRKPRLPAGLTWRRRTGETPRSERCLNCQARLVGSFCHECGQENVNYVVSFGELLREIYGEFVQLDGRLLKTVVPLVIRPGFLTNEFLAGKRVRYLSPFKMYIVVSALFFLLFTIFNPMPFDDADVKTGPIARAFDSPGFSFTPDDEPATNGANGEVPAAPKPPTAPGAKAASGDAAVAFSTVLAQSSRWGAEAGVKTSESKFHLSAFGINTATLPASVHEYREQQENLPRAKRHGLFQSFIALKLIRFQASPADALRSLIYATLPNIMVFMLPLFALLLKLMYLRDKRLYVEHFIFVLHTHTFMFIALALATLSPWTWVDRGVFLTIPVYNVIALRTVYRQSYPKTFLKGFLLWNGYGLLLIFAAALGLVLAVFSTLLSPG